MIAGDPHCAWPLLWTSGQCTAFQAGMNTEGHDHLHTTDCLQLKFSASQLPHQIGVHIGPPHLGMRVCLSRVPVFCPGTLQLCFFRGVSPMSVACRIRHPASQMTDSHASRTPVRCPGHLAWRCAGAHTGHSKALQMPSKQGMDGWLPVCFSCIH